MKSHLAILALTAWSALGPAHCSALDAAGRPTPPQKVADEAIIWADKAHTQALFIPEPILNSVPVAELPLSASDRKWLEDALKPLVPDPGPVRHPRPVPADPCGSDLHSGGEPQENAMSLPQILKSGPPTFVLLGRVTQLVPGFNIGYRRVSSMIRFEVLEILKQDYRWPLVGDSMFYEQRHGSIHVLGRLWCEASAHKEYFRVSVGQTVLLSGFGPWDSDPRLLFGAFAWPVTADGNVLPEPDPLVRQDGPVPLALIREALRGGVTP